MPRTHASPLAGPPLGLSLVVAILPKCPVCFMAHASVAGSLGLGGVATGSWGRGATAAALGVALGLLAYRAPARRGYGPLALGCAAAALVAFELFHVHAPAAAHVGHGAASGEPHAPLLAWAGVALLVAASLWNAWPRRASPSAAAASEACGRHC